MTNSENDKLEHIIFDNGTEFWKYSNTNVHQDEDLPAEILPHGTEIYYKNGIHHRKLGPTIKRPNGHEQWDTKTKNGWHRKDGATVILSNGERKYRINGKIVNYDKFKEQAKT